MGEYNPIESEYVYQYCKSIDKELLNIFINHLKDAITIEVLLLIKIMETMKEM